MFSLLFPRVLTCGPGRDGLKNRFPPLLLFHRGRDLFSPLFWRALVSRRLVQRFLSSLPPSSLGFFPSILTRAYGFSLKAAGLLVFDFATPHGSPVLSCGFSATFLTRANWLDILLFLTIFHFFFEPFWSPQPCQRIRAGYLSSLLQRRVFSFPSAVFVLCSRCCQPSHVSPSKRFFEFPGFF